jgi:hypothetical protein
MLLLKPAYVERSYYTDLLDQACDAKYLAPRPGIHNSDICGSCPKQAAFIALDKHRKLSKRSKNYFFSGEAVDEKLRNMFTNRVKGHYDTAKTVTLGPIIGNPDLYDIDNDTVLEIKSTDPNKWTPLPRSHQMDQLIGYMAMMDCQKGVLWYYILTRKQDDGFWREFHITLTKAELQEKRNEMLDDAMSLEGAINAKNPDLARNVASDPEFGWKCKNYCDYIDYCEQGYATQQRLFGKTNLKSQLEASLVGIKKLKQ